MQKNECTRIEYLAQFSEHALSMMSNEGYRLEDDTLETCTRAEIAAVEAHREARYQEWLIENPVAELASYDEGPEIIGRVVLRVFGGHSHPHRVEAAHDYLEGFTETETKPVCVDSYECTARTTETGAAYVEFVFSNMPVVPVELHTPTSTKE